MTRKGPGRSTIVSIILSIRQAFADFGANEAQNNKDISVSRNTIAFPFHRAFLTLHNLYTATKFSTFICIICIVCIPVYMYLRPPIAHQYCRQFSSHTLKNLDCSDDCLAIFLFHSLQRYIGSL